MNLNPQNLSTFLWGCSSAVFHKTALKGRCALLLVFLFGITCHALPGSPQVLKVAIAQPLVEPGDVRGNIDRMAPLVAEASKQEAQLVVFSECGITGYDLKGVGAKAAIPLSDPALDRVAKMAKKHDIVVLAGFHEMLGKDPYNSAQIFYPCGRRVLPRKHLVLDLEKSIAPVQCAPVDRELFEIDGFRLALLICSDAGIPNIFDKLAADGCDGVIVNTAGGGDAKSGVHQAALSDPKLRKKTAFRATTCLAPSIVEQCIRLNCAQIACNQSGWNPETGYFQIGGSSIIDRTGEVTAVIPARVVFEYLRPVVEVGFITKRKATE